tara:strand:+ start:171 stop:275 length:105 start_codon:yes stop_codon:yes gene_type:complete
LISNFKKLNIPGISSKASHVQNIRIDGARAAETK